MLIDSFNDHISRIKGDKYKPKTQNFYIFSPYFYVSSNKVAGNSNNMTCKHLKASSLFLFPYLLAWFTNLLGSDQRKERI